MSRTKEELLQASRQVKNETQQGANTADRIGGILYDITEHIGEGGNIYPSPSASDTYLHWNGSGYNWLKPASSPLLGGFLNSLNSFTTPTSLSTGYLHYNGTNLEWTNIPTGGGISLDDMWEALEGEDSNEQIDKSHIPDIYLTKSAFTSATFWGMHPEYSNSNNMYTVSGDIADAGSITMWNTGKSKSFKFEVDSNGDLKFNGNIYATGGVSALGNSSGGSGGGGIVLNEPLLSINRMGNPAPGADKILKWTSTGSWTYADPPIAGSGLTANSWAAYFDDISHQGVTATSGFLKLQNGSLTWGTPEGTLPAYTATNDGQFLMISPTSHQPEWATSTGGSGVAGVNILANTTTTSVAGANETFAVVQGNGITLTPDTVNHAVEVATKIQSVQIQAISPLASTNYSEQSEGKVSTTIQFNQQAANTVLAGPAVAGTIPEGESEYTAAPTFRALVAADIPSLDASKITGNINATLLNGKDIVIPGTEITPGAYSDKIPFIGSDYVMDVGRYMDFHEEDGNGDYATRIQLSLNNGNPWNNTVTLPSGDGTLALTTDNVASATKLNTTGTRTVWGQTYWEDGVPRTVSNAPLTGVTGITMSSGNIAMTNGDITGANNISMSGKLTIGGTSAHSILEYDATNNALKINGDVYATGGISALGNSSGSGGGGTGVALTSPLLDINQSGLTPASAAGKVLVSTGNNNQWGYRNWPSIEDLYNIDRSPGVGDVPIFTHNSLSDSDEWAYTKVVSGIGVPVTSGTQTYATGDVLLQGSGNVTVSRNNNTITISGSGGSSGGGYWISDSNANPSINFGALSSNRLLISAVYPITFAGSSAPTGTSNDIRLNIGINGTVVPTVAYANDGQVLTANGNYGTVGWSDLPIASISKIGGIKLTSSSSSDPSINAPSTDAGKYYPVQVNSTGEAYVNVPWTGGTSGGISISDVWNALATNDSTKVINNSHINMALGDLSNVSETNVAQGKYLLYNGSNWVPASLSIQDGSSVEQTIYSTIGFTDGAGISTTAASGGNLTITNTGLLGLKIPNDSTWRTGKVILKAGSNVSITGSSTGSGTNVVHEIEITASGAGGTITAIQDSQLSDLFYFYYNDNN